MSEGDARGDVGGDGVEARPLPWPLCWQERGTPCSGAGAKGRALIRAGAGLGGNGSGMNALRVPLRLGVKFRRRRWTGGVELKGGRERMPVFCVWLTEIEKG